MLLTGCTSISHKYGKIGARASDEQIRETLIRATPIGSSHQDVRAFINNDLDHLGGSFYPALDHSNVAFPFPPSLSKAKHRAKKDLTRYEYIDVPDLSSLFPRAQRNSHLDRSQIKVQLAIYGKLMGSVWVSAYWEFDLQGKLINVEIDKARLGP